MVIDHIYKSLCYSVPKHILKVLLAKSAVVVVLKIWQLSTITAAWNISLCYIFANTNYYQLNVIYWNVRHALMSRHKSDIKVLGFSLNGRFSILGRWWNSRLTKTSI
jgi:hypothetical protein